MNRLLRYIPRWAATATATTAILYLTLVPSPLPPDMDLPIFPGADKIAHALMFVGLYWTLAFDLMRRHDPLRLRAVSRSTLLALIPCVITFGGLIELLQMAMGMGRSAELADFGADSLGVILAYLSTIIIQRRIPS